MAKKVKIVYNQYNSQEFTIEYEVKPEQLAKNNVLEKQLFVKGKKGGEYTLSQSKKHPEFWELCPIRLHGKCERINTQNNQHITFSD